MSTGTRQAVWFVGLWLMGVATVVAVAFVLRLVMSAMAG